jgi:hypothetical protein
VAAPKSELPVAASRRRVSAGKVWWGARADLLSRRRLAPSPRARPDGAAPFPRSSAPSRPSNPLLHCRRGVPLPPPRRATTSAVSLLNARRPTADLQRRGTTVMEECGGDAERLGRRLGW